MRDIDFDELDKAVNRFLGKPESTEKVEVLVENPTEEAPVAAQDATSAPLSAMVFAPRQVVSASDFHATASSKIEKLEDAVKEEVREETPEISNEEPAIFAPKNSELHENFAEKTVRKHEHKHGYILDNFKNMKFEEPILSGNYSSDDEPEFLESSEKVMPELKSQHEIATSVDSFVKPEVKEEKEILNQETQPSEGLEKATEEVVAEAPILSDSVISPVPFTRENAPRIAVPERPGIHPIEENEDEIVVFGSKNENPETENSNENLSLNEEISKSLTEDANLETENSNDEEKIEVQISKPAEENSKEENSENEVSEPSKISVNFVDEDEKTDEDLAEQTIEVPQIDDSNVSKIDVREVEGQNEEIKEAEIVTQTVSADKISTDDIKTPFVQNAKIEKRPLGMAQSSGTNFDIKPIDRSREIRRAKIENSQPSAPMLARDEYSAPIVSKKKKSGWLVVFFVMLLLAIFGAGGGYAIWYFFGQR